MDAVRRPISSVLGATAIGLAALLALSACAVRSPVLGGPAPTPASTAPACAQPGPASDSVQVDADLGEAPVIVADGPYDVDRVERSVLVPGSGEPAAEGDLVAVAVTIMNATSGERAPGTATARVLLDPDALQPGLLATILCTPAGGRVVGVVPADQAFGGAGQPELAIGPDDDLVLVVDVLQIIPQTAVGDEVPLPGDFPAVEVGTASDGSPTLTLPDSEPPAATVSAVLIAGAGPVVASGDEFLVQFRAVNWRTHEVFDDTWDDAPRSLLTVLPGVDAAIVGSSVGSRIVVVVAPGDGFGSTGSPSSGVLPTDTVVYVVDILATTPPPAS